jgi:hypothetical protein
MSDLPAAPERIRIRQVALCVSDIRPTERAIEQALDITCVHRDKPGAPIWMFNGVFPVGQTFLEILQPERAEAPTQKFLEKQGGDAGYMLILQVDNLEQARLRVEADGVRIVADMQPRQYHGIEGGAIHLHPGDTGGALMSFDWMADWDAWAWAGQAWPWHQRTSVVSKIVAVEISSPAPDVLATRYARLLGRPLNSDGTISLEDSHIRFIQGPPKSRDRLSGIDMTAADRERVGETFNFARTRITLV